MLAKLNGGFTKTGRFGFHEKDIIWVISYIVNKYERFLPESRLFKELIIKDLSGRSLAFKIYLLQYLFHLFNFFMG